MGAFATALRPPELRALTERAWEAGRTLGWAEPTASGRSVTIQDSLQLIAVYACVSLIAETVGTLPLDLMQVVVPRGHRTDPRHPMYPILRERPNPEMTANETWETVTGQVAMRGNAFLSKEPLRNGAYHLWPLRPDMMGVERDRSTGTLRYRYTLPSGEQRALAPDELVHIRGFGSDGYVGYSRIGLAREALGRQMAVEEYGARFFSNSSRPSGYLTTPGELTEPAALRLQADWERLHRGLDNAHRVAVLEQGTTWQQIGIPPNDAQFIETEKWGTALIATLFRVPPHLISQTERTTSWGTGIAQQGQAFVEYTLLPYTSRLEARLKVDTVPEQGYYLHFNAGRLLRGDQRERYEAYRIGRAIGVLTPNDCREMEGLNPLEVAGADDAHINLNMAPLDQIRYLPMPEHPPGYRELDTGRLRTNGHGDEDLDEVMAILAARGDASEN